MKQHVERTGKLAIIGAGGHGKVIADIAQNGIIGAGSVVMAGTVINLYTLKQKKLLLFFCAA